MYSVTNAPNTENVSELAGYIQRELQVISEELGRLDRGELLLKYFVEPSKLRDGLVVLADGTSWDPGSGAGAYCYYGGAWHFLG